MEQAMVSLKPFDIVVAIKIGCNERRLGHGDLHSSNSVAELAESLFKGKSEVSRSISRLTALNLLTERPASAADPVASNRKFYALNRSAIGGLLVHGIKYIFGTTKLGYGRGVATGWHCPMIRSPMNPPEIALVWPSPSGDEDGEQLEPLYERCAEAAKNDIDLYYFLALIDVIRTGKPRELKYASELLLEKINELHS